MVPMLLLAASLLQTEAPSGPPGVDRAPSPGFTTGLFVSQGSPFEKLFGPGQIPRTAPPAPLYVRPQKPTVICGMVLIPADPRIDPGIIIQSREQNRKHSIRKIEPPVCRPE